MATKQAIAHKAPEVWNEDGTPKILVRIEGLQQVDEGEFEISGVKPRDIDWPAVAKALRIEGPMSDRLADDIQSAVWQHDIIEVLASRTRPV